MKLRTLAVGAVALALSLPAFAHEFTLGDLVIHHPYAFDTAPNARNAAGYMEVENTGSTADRLIGARADFSDVQLHKTEKNSDGAMQMIHQEDGIEIPAGATVTFAPGGYHMMFLGLDGRFVPDEPREVTLVFQNAGEVKVSLAISSRKSDEDGMKHDEMEHDEMEHEGMDHGGTEHGDAMSN